MEEAQTTGLIGKLVGRYRIEKRLGSGGMGEVYLARQVEIGSRVAIKVMAHRSKVDSEGAKRMFAEARAVNLVQHDRIVNVLDMTRIDGRPALIMEHLRGVSLDRLIGGGPVPPRCVAELAIDILDGLSAVHAQEIFHRDLKPGNVFVSPEGRATLLDFGLAKMADDMLGTVIQTQAGMVMGTVPYMAPEQSRGEPFTAASDIFAVGALLYEAATGRRPFRGVSIFELLKEHEQGADPSKLAAVPPPLQHIILRALAVDISGRYGSAEEMKLELGRCQGDFEPASVRKRVERFRHASSVFVGVQPAFSDAPTVAERKNGSAKPAKRSKPDPQDRAAARFGGSDLNKLLLTITIVSVLAAVGTAVFAFTLRQRLGERESAAQKLASPNTQSRRTPPRATPQVVKDTEDTKETIPSLDEWKLDDGAAAVVPKDAGSDTSHDAKKKPSRPFDDDSDLLDPFSSKPIPKVDAEKFLRQARDLLDREPRLALRYIKRGMAAGGTRSRFHLVKAEALCRLRDRAGYRATLLAVGSRATRARIEKTCKKLWPARPSSSSPMFDLE